MKGEISRMLVLLAALPLLAGCGVKERAEAVWDKTVPAVLEKVPFMYKESKPTGVTYPANSTGQVQAIFAVEQAPVACKVFAHLLIWTPAGANGRGLANVVEKEGRRYGADMILLGRSRNAKADEGMAFVYYGPDQPYSCRDRWSGWKFGYADWVNQGDWASVGYEEWGKRAIWFDAPMVMQAAFLRCQPDASEKR